jgi:hypothetical protein
MQLTRLQQTSLPPRVTSMFRSPSSTWLIEHQSPSLLPRGADHWMYSSITPASWSAITGQPQKQVLVGLTEIDSEVQMEYGLILPHPGGETEWFATNKDALDGIQGAGL